MLDSQVPRGVGAIQEKLLDTVPKVMDTTTLSRSVIYEFIRTGVSDPSSKAGDD